MLVIDNMMASAFKEEMEKISFAKGSLGVIKSFLKRPEGIAATVTGTGVVGAGFIDTRKMPDREAKTILPYWEEVKKYAKPGDVIVGANRPPAIMSYFSDFKKQYDKARKTHSSKESIAIARDLVNPVTMISKVSDPVYSHAAVIGPNGKTIYGGGGEARDITQRDLPNDAKELKKFRKRGLEPYYALLRPNKASANKLFKTYKKQGAAAALKKVETLAGNPSDYRLSRAIWEQAKKWVLPKVNVEEFVKSDMVRKLEKKMTGGVCSTTAALLSNRTIAGKDAKRVLPKDIVRSPDFDIIAHIGHRDNGSLVTEAVFAAPKYAVKATAGVASGGAAYGITKGIKAMLKTDAVKKIVKSISKMK